MTTRSTAWGQMAICHPARPNWADGLCHVCARAKWIQDHPERSRMYRRVATLKGYGLSMAEFVDLWERQGRKCANSQCGSDLNIDVYGNSTRREASFRNSIHIDHDHATGLVRGLLCSPCNKALGMIRDDVARLRGLVHYLESKLEVAS